MHSLDDKEFSKKERLNRENTELGSGERHFKNRAFKNKELNADGYRGNMDSFSPILTYAFELATLLNSGEPTGALLRSYLEMFSDPQQPQSTTPFSITNFRFDHGAMQEKVLEEESAIQKTTASLREATARLKQAMTEELPEPKTKRTTTKIKQQLQREEKEEKERRQQREKYRKTLFAYDIQTIDEDIEEKKKFIDNLYKSRYHQNVETKPKDPSLAKTEILQRKKEAAKTIQKFTQELPKPKPKPRPIVKKPPPPPFAQDLLDWDDQLTKEQARIKSLLSNNTATATPITDTLAILRKKNDTPQDIQDYHMKYALLFQQLENLESRLAEIEDQCPF